MEGWNDCPLPMLSQGGPPRQRKRASRAIGLRISASESSTNVGNGNGSSSVTQPPSPVESPETNLQRILNIYELKDIEQSVLSLISALPSLQERDKLFLNQILAAIIRMEPIASLQGLVVKFMIMNSEAKEWCSHLNRLLEYLGRVQKTESSAPPFPRLN